MKKLSLIVSAMLLIAAFSVYAGGSKEKTQPAPSTSSSTSSSTSTTMAAPKVKNPDTFIEATIGDAQTFDPATAYDTASWTIIYNVYDRLVDYDRTSIDKFVPMLATEIPTEQNGGISADGKTYRFKIRQGVTFQNGDPLMAEDVAYSFKRNMVLDPDGGPDWIWFNIFMGSDVNGSRDGKGKINVTWNQINNAVSVEGNTVVFHLAAPFPAFLSVLAGQWASVVDKKFVVAHGGWDGTGATWEKYNNPETGKETLQGIVNGTGPYKLTRWDHGSEIVLDRNDSYWGPKPALREGVYKVVKEWSTRKLMLLQGDADYVYVPPQNYSEMDGEAGIKVAENLPSISLDGINFNLKIHTDSNPGVYSGKLDGNGIPGDFFSDKNVRLGFVHSWDEATFLKDAVGGHAIDPVTPIPKGLPYKDPSLTNFKFDPAMATEYFKKAWGGQLWAKGFKMDFLYNSGNTTREIGMKMLAENIMKLNPKFQINVRGVEWPVYLNANRHRTMPLFFIGWAPDYPDPADYVFPYMSSNGTYAGRASYINPEADKLIAQAAVSLDPAVRKADYYKLQQIWLQDAIGIMTTQPVVNRYYKDWVKGNFYNPMQSDVLDLLRYMSK